MYSAIAKNKRNTVFIMLAFVLLIAAIGYFVQWYMNDGTMTIFWSTFAVAIIYALIQYFAAGKLAIAMNGARKVEKREAPELYRIIENLTITTGMPMPEVYIIDDPAPNAFATGRDPKHAIVGVTTGLLDIMDKRELTAVLAHEIGHVQNYDIRVSMITFGLTSVIGLLSDIALRMVLFSDGDDDGRNPLTMIVGVIVVILAPIIATLVQLAISRQREYLADATGALTTRDSEGLASALGKLQQYGRPMKKQVSASANMFLNNPLKKSIVSRLFSTHPPLEERIARLQNNATKM
jgi:heat shock protein HtpX